ncbi:MAG: hypothetical protein V1862_06155 [Methanobacteriota archaeon]
MAGDQESLDGRLARIETKLDTVLEILPDHETRIRSIEQKKEECQRDTRLDKIEVRLDDGEKRFDNLEIKVNSHIESQTATTNLDEKQVLRNREWIILLVGLIEGSFCTAIITKLVEGFFS